MTECPNCTKDIALSQVRDLRDLYRRTSVQLGGPTGRRLLLVRHLARGTAVQLHAVLAHYLRDQGDWPGDAFADCGSKGGPAGGDSPALVEALRAIAVHIMRSDERSHIEYKRSIYNAYGLVKPGPPWEFLNAKDIRQGRRVTNEPRLIGLFDAVEQMIERS